MFFPSAYTVFSIVTGLVFAFICSNIAENKGRSSVGWFFAGFFGTVVSLIIILVLPADTGGYRGNIPQRPVPHDGGQAQVQPPRSNGKIQLRGISGYFQSAEIDLNPDEWIIIGRDVNACHLVYPTDNADISRRHCKVKYDPASRTFVVVDLFSSNGTFQASGQRMEANEPYRLSSGQRFYLSNQANTFECRA